MTDAEGKYTLTIHATLLGTYTVGVIKPNIDWTFTDPGGDGVENVFAGPGSPTQLVNFFLQPPNDPNGGNGQLGSIVGVVFNDIDTDGLRDVGEGGLPGVRVFIDADENGVWDSVNEVSVLTAANGGFSFANLQPGLIRIDVHIPNEGTPNAAWAVTTPTIGYREIQLGPGGSVVGVTFGLDNRADQDWGDLPNSFLTLSTSNGPRHGVNLGFRLGSAIDGEVNGIPSPTATGDDSVGDTDDGVRVLSNGGFLQPGVNLLEVTVFGFGGVLTGWIDWNKNNQFEANERLVWQEESGGQLGGEADLVQGTFRLQVVAPANMQDGPLGARFRWGEPGLDFFGPAMIGEVEDYFLPAMRTPLSGLDGDYNNDQIVDLADLVLWRRYLDTNTFLPNDTTPGTVTQADYDVWRNNFGPQAGAGAGTTSEFLAESSEPAAAVVVASTETVIAPAEVDFAPAASSRTGSSTEIAVSAAPQPASIVDSSADILSESAPITAPLAVDLTASRLASASIQVASDLVPSDAAVGADAGSDATLLLLDQALAELDVVGDDGPLCDRFRHDEQDVGELELAAVFEDESSWWSI